MADPFLSIQHVRKTFGTTTVVQDFNLDAGAGEFVSFLGPSGCGKTTVLRMVAGFEEPTAGSIVVAGKDITRLKPNQRNIGMVFQAYALFPNLTVAQNVGFGLKVAGMAKADADKRVAEMLASSSCRNSATAIPISSPAASSSASRWPGRWRRSRSCCCSTSRCRRSTPRSAFRCARRSARSRRRSASPPSS